MGKNTIRIRIVITRQTLNGLRRLTDMSGYDHFGKTIDKLVREKLISLREEAPM